MDDYILCEECNVKTSLRGLRARSWHMNSKGHRLIKRIRALAQHDCMSYAEIGRRVGMSEIRVCEIVRRMLPELEGKGGDRRINCTIDRKLAEWWKLHKDEPVIKKLQERGIPFDPVPQFRDGYVKRYTMRRVTIGGKLVEWYRFHLIRTRWGEYFGMYNVKPWAAKIDFRIYHYRDERFYIFPIEFLRRVPEHIGFSDDPGPSIIRPKWKPGKRRRPPRPRHDYQNYREAWTLLPRVKRESATADSSKTVAS